MPSFWVAENQNQYKTKHNNFPVLSDYEQYL